VYRQLQIQRFRSFEDFHVDGLRRINLLVGMNNTGKTSLLEAVFLLGGATNPVFPLTIGQLRGQRLGNAIPDPIWRSLYRNLDPSESIEIAGQWNDEAGWRRLSVEALAVSTYADFSESLAVGTVSADDTSIGGLRLRYQPAQGSQIVTEAVFDPKTGNVNAPSVQREDFVRSSYLSARAYSSLARDAEQLSYLVKIKREDEVVDALRIVEPSINRLEVVSEAGASTIYADVGLPSLAPLAVCGEGMVRLFSMVVAITGSRDGVLLVDEIDNGLHHSVMQDLWQMLRQMTDKHDVQVFATTHNEELVESAIHAFEDCPETLGLFRLDRRNGRQTVVSYNEAALRAVEAEGFEVRG